MIALVVVRVVARVDSRSSVAKRLSALGCRKGGGRSRSSRSVELVTVVAHGVMSFVRVDTQDAVVVEVICLGVIGTQIVLGAPVDVANECGIGEHEVGEHRVYQCES